MPSATLIHAACFAVGAAVGAGAVAAVGISKQRAPPLAQPTGIPPPGRDTRAIVKSGPAGLPDLVELAQQHPGAVLKYGNPGMSRYVFCFAGVVSLTSLQVLFQICLYGRRMSLPMTGD